MFDRVWNKTLKPLCTFLERRVKTDSPLSIPVGRVINRESITSFIKLFLKANRLISRNEILFLGIFFWVPILVNKYETCSGYPILLMLCNPVLVTVFFLGALLKMAIIRNFFMEGSLLGRGKPISGDFEFSQRKIFLPE